MSPLSGRTVVVTGGTGGIGRATALRLRAAGADVVAIGRSAAKAADVQARATATPGPGSLRAVVADLSAMSTVEATVADLAESVQRIDLLVHTVGILIATEQHSAEGIELDFAVSYLSRFAFLEAASRAGLLHAGTRMINVAASAPRVPRYARMEFDTVEQVTGRVGMRGHGQAQLANDLLTAAAPDRYGITAIGYGPGSVDTDIRREVPAVIRAVMRPFFARSSRRPDAVAADLVDLLTDVSLPPGSATFADRRGIFPTPDFIADPRRQQALLTVSTALLDRARQGHRDRE